MQTVLTTTLVVAVISLFFAVILTIADRYLNDYGEVQLIINDDEGRTVDGGSTLLKTLSNEKIFIPSACGGKGTCGYCKCKVTDGGGPVLATEKPWLSEEEMADNVRLSCQVKVKEDIHIKIPEELFNVKEFETTLVKVTPVTDRINLLRFELPEGETIDFKPGQFIQLKSAAYKKGEDYDGYDTEEIRAYSIASSITDNKHVELLVGFTKGIVSTYVHRILDEGSKVILSGPFGDFFFHDEDQVDEILLVAAGTGFAPIRSILYHMRDHDIQTKATFYFGARTPDDLFLLDEMEMFEKELHDFEFKPVLSRTTEEHQWTGDTGRVNNSIDKYVDGSGKTQYSAYLCGNPKMIETMISSLTDKNIPVERIYFDEF